MKRYSPHFLKKTPFLKLFIALSAGILLQWYLPAPVIVWWIAIFVNMLILVLFFYISLSERFRLFFIAGLATIFLFISVGALLVQYNNIKNNKNWFGRLYKTGNEVIALLDEPLSEKARSYKVNARVLKLLQHDSGNSVSGKIILYFKKESKQPPLHYGSMILFNKELQPIKNSGNPGGFDYERYALFQGITHQVYLKEGEYAILPTERKNWFRSFIYLAQRKVIHVIRDYILRPKEQGLAEALLIGYKDDLDQALVQSYTNTGVVHIIAISGMHIGLIYGLLMLLCKPLRRKKKFRLLTGLIVITGIWLFSIMAGGGPSVLRSALMFTCIVEASMLNRKTNIYNTLSISAFILLCIDPFWLWDVGFQLSYSAVLSIIIFFRPIYNWFYFKNRILDFIWKMNAVSLAAQVLTVPLSIYHFHQFPPWFLLTNFLAIPLSSVIILGEIALVAIAWWTHGAMFCGKLVTWMMWLMDSWIEAIEKFWFSLWDGLQVTVWQTILLYIFIAGMGFWSLPAGMAHAERSKKWLLTALLSLSLFAGIRAFSFFEKTKQQKIIIYNVPRYRAIDFVQGRKYFFAGDTELLRNDFLRNFHLKPSRVMNRISPSAEIPDLIIPDHFTRFGGLNILWLDTGSQLKLFPGKTRIDLLIISGKPKLNIPQLSRSLDICKIVFDGSVPFWKLSTWKHTCDSLHIAYHDVNEKGAFVMNIR